MASRLFDHPQDLAILRRLARSGRAWCGAEDIRTAVAWLDHPEHSVGYLTWARLRAMEDAGVVEARRAPSVSSGREWRLADGVNLKRVTGGIDPSKIDREEALLAGELAKTGARVVEFRPDAYLLAPGNTQKVRRALRQCPSPWALAQRLEKIDWINPDLE